MEVDGEVERVGAGAVVGVGVAVGVDARGCIVCAMPVVTVTGLLLIAVVCAVVDGEVQVDGAVAANGVKGGEMGVEGGVGESSAMPDVVVARDDGFDRVGGVVDGQVEGGDGVAAGGVG